MRGALTYSTGGLTASGTLRCVIFVAGKKPALLIRVGDDAALVRVVCQGTPYILLSATDNTITSAGVTPASLPACPTVPG